MRSMYATAYKERCYNTPTMEVYDVRLTSDIDYALVERERIQSSLK